MAELLPPARKPAPLDAAMVLSLVTVGVVAALMAIAGLVLGGPSTGLGLAVGGLVATLNLWFFAHIGRGVLAGGPRGRLFAILALFKFGGLFGGVWFLLKAELTSPLTLAIGYGALPLGITIASFLRREPPVEGPGTGGGDEPSRAAENLVPADPELDNPPEPGSQA